MSDEVGFQSGSVGMGVVFQLGSVGWGSCFSRVVGWGSCFSRVVLDGGPVPVGQCRMGVSCFSRVVSDGGGRVPVGKCRMRVMFQLGSVGRGSCFSRVVWDGGRVYFEWGCVTCMICWLYFLLTFTAGSVMYEFGMRLGLELPGLESLQKQVRFKTATNAKRTPASGTTPPPQPNRAFVEVCMCVTQRKYVYPRTITIFSSQRFPKLWKLQQIFHSPCSAS